MPNFEAILKLEPRRDWQRMLESPWTRLSTRSLLVYRLFCSAYVLYAILFTLVHFGNWTTYTIYATNWAALVMLALFVGNSYLTFRKYVHEDQPLERSFLRVQFALYEIALSSSFTVVAMYWLVVYKPGKPELDLLASIQNHACTAFLLLVDFVLSDMAVIGRHVFLPLLLITVYFPVNAVYSLVESPVYDAITWRSLGTVIVVIQAYVGQIVFFGLFYGLGHVLGRYRRGVELGVEPTESQYNGNALR